MSFISRAHVQLEVQNDALLAINISNNPVYVVGSSFSSYAKWMSRIRSRSRRANREDYGPTRCSLKLLNIFK